MAKLTSITKDKLETFIRSANEREQLGCEKIPGFFYLQLKTGGAWRLRYTDLQGKRRTATIADGNTKPAQAAEIAAEWRAQLKNGLDPLSHKEQLAEQQRAEEQQKAANKYLNTGHFFEAIYTPHKKDNARYADGTLKGIKRNFGHLFSRDMDKITGADILEWYNKRRAARVMRSTLVRDYGAFKAMLNFAAKTPDGTSPAVLSDNPIKNYNLPALTISEQDEQEKHNEKLEAKRDIISESDRLKISKGLERYAEKIREQRRSSRKHGKPHLPDLDAVEFPHWFIPFCHIARLTGMRPADIYSLKWDNVQHNRFNGQSTLIFTPSKTRKAENSRKVKFPIAGELKQVLDAWREQNGNPETGLLFKSERNGGKLEKKAHGTHWKQVKTLGGVNADLDFYSFRHNFISDLVADGVPVSLVAMYVGHKDGSMIAANYLRHDEQDSAGIIEAFSNKWSRAAELSKAVV